MNKLKSKIDGILNNPANVKILRQFYKYARNGDYSDGHSHQLYVDLETDSLFINTEVSSNSRLSRADGSLIYIYSHDLPGTIRDSYNDWKSYLGFQLEMLIGTLDSYYKCN